MTNLAVQEFNGQLIRIRKEDRYVCLTDMAKAAGKQFGHWNESKSAKSYIATLSETIGIPIDKLIEIQEGRNGGTWAHPKVALRFAQWCSDEFAVQVDCWIDELLTTGKVELEQIPQLPQRDPIKYIYAAEKLEKINNLTLQQLLRDELIDHLHIKQGKKALPGATKKPEYTIAKVRARELGYNMTEVGSGATLGKFIAKHIPAAFIERVGKYDVKHYEITDKLDALIHNYFALKANLA